MRKIATWILVLGMATAPAAMAADGNDKSSDVKTEKTSTTRTKQLPPLRAAPNSKRKSNNYAL